MLIHISLSIEVEPVSIEGIRDDDWLVYRGRSGDPVGVFVATIVEGVPWVTNGQNFSLKVSRFGTRVKWFRIIQPLKLS